MSTTVPRLPPKEVYHPCPLCYVPMHELVCEQHGEMEWCRIHKAAYVPGTHVCKGLQLLNDKRASRKQVRDREYQRRRYVHVTPTQCILCGMPLNGKPSRGRRRARFCQTHKYPWYGRFRYLVYDKKREGRAVVSEEEAEQIIIKRYQDECRS